MKNAIRLLSAGWFGKGRSSAQDCLISGALSRKGRRVRSLRSLGLLGIACLWVGTASAQTVTILQPANNSTVSSPVKIQATVQDSSTVTYTQIYVDGVKKYSVSGSGLNTSLSMSSGTHRIAVQAGDKAGRVFKSAVSVNVSGTSSSSTTPTVTILQPVNNSTVSSPVKIQATVQDSSTVQYTQIYVDGAKKYSISGSGVNTSLSMSSGNHRIAVQAGDSAGHVFKSAVYVNVSGGSTTTTSSTSSSVTKLYDRVEEKTGWQTCGNCGNTGATGATATYHMTRGISSPSEDGSSAKFSISGPAFKNGYWWISHTPAPTGAMKYLRYEFDIYIPKGYENAPQAIEFECQQRLNGWVYNFAWQAEYPSSVWRVFNYTGRKWESTGIYFKHFTPGTWHHIVTEFHNDPSTHRVYHDAITVDGVRHKVTQNAVHSAKNTGGSNYLNNAFQLDLNGKGTAYHVFVDRMKVGYR